MAEAQPACQHDGVVLWSRLRSDGLRSRRCRCQTCGVRYTMQIRETDPPPRPLRVRGGPRTSYTIEPATLGIKCRHRKGKKKPYGVCRNLCGKCYGKYVALVNPQLVAEKNRRHMESYYRNQEARRQAIRARYQRRPEWKRRDSRARAYGLTIYQYNQIAKEQEYGCAICGTVPKLRLNVDHCHQTKRVRGLLCWRCNRGLEHFRDDPRLFRVAAVYLESEFDGRQVVPERGVLGHLARKAKKAGGVLHVDGPTTPLVVMTPEAFRARHGPLPGDPGWLEVWSEMSGPLPPGCEGGGGLAEGADGLPTEVSEEAYP